MSTTTTQKLEVPSVLSFERKLDPSDALMHCGNWADRNNHATWDSVPIATKSVRGVISNRMKAGEVDPAKLDAAIEKPNLQTVDIAALPQACDTVKLSFSLRILPGLGKASACNSSAFQTRLNELVGGYMKAHGATTLAQRYAHNLACGRFLWRNRVGAESVEVHVAHVRDGRAVAEWAFDALALSINSFEAEGAAKKALEELSQVIAEGLAGNQPHTLLHVRAFARMGAGQEVYPSQELVLDKKDEKSKTLYHVKTIAAMHSQKVGNAIRTIDTWYDSASVNGPIAVEPYGSVTTLGTAFRQPKAKEDFYNLFDAWTVKDKAPTDGNQHFVMAVLVRGGVFGKAEKPAAAETASDASADA